MMDDPSFDLDWPYVKAPVDYRKICQPGTFQEMWHCCQVPDRRHAHLVPIRSRCAVTYDKVPKGAPSRFNPTLGLGTYSSVSIDSANAICLRRYFVRPMSEASWLYVSKNSFDVKENGDRPLTPPELSADKLLLVLVKYARAK